MPLSVVEALTEVSEPRLILLIVAALTGLVSKVPTEALKHINPAIVIDWEKLDLCLVEFFFEEIDGVG
jgi:uncharacterized membrane protein (DUF106 family)